MAQPSETNKAIEQVNTMEIDAGVSRLWNHFDTFTRIARQTGQEHIIGAHLRDWADSKGYFQEIDKKGNRLILVPPTPGFENAPGIILQGHTDIVCVGDPNPAIFGVTPTMSEDGEWIEAKGTSLGADNGIGLGAVLALAEEDSHGPLALMLTVNEEIGLEGALAMDFQTLLDKFQYLLNFDSEDEGEATISCAGGGDSLISLPIITEEVNPQSLQMNISLSGLMGGHSGMEIHEHRLNSIKSITTVLERLKNLNGFQLVSLNAGQARNVIPSEAQLQIAINAKEASKVQGLLSSLILQILTKSQNLAETSLQLTAGPAKSKSQQALSKESSDNLIQLLNELPNGVQTWSQSVDGLVETSTNLAVVETQAGQIKVEAMTRSSVDADIAETREAVKTTSETLGASVELPPSYPGWPAKPESPINAIATEEWYKLTGKELKIIAIHAGLECGAIIGKYPHLKAVSIGPTIKGAHSIKEKVKIDTVATFYQFAKKIVQKIATL